VRDDPDEEPWVEADPVNRPLASRYVVCELSPEFGRVVAVPMIRPEASRIVDCTVPPACFCRSMVWTIRPEESRTTSRQVWAGEVVVKDRENTAESRIFFISGYD